MTDPTPSASSFESTSVAAILARRSRDDLTELLEELVTLLSEVVPNVHVERAFLRRYITAVRLPLGAHVYALKRSSAGTFEATRLQEVRGVVIRTDQMEVDAFLAELGPALDAELQRTERGRDALKVWLNSISP